MNTIRTQVGIIGAGPAGLTLAIWLKKLGIEAVIIENRSREYTESRVRAGLLEQNTVDIFKNLGVSERLEKQGLEHTGVHLNFDNESLRVPFAEITNGRNITIYGQQEVIKDLGKKWSDEGGVIFYEATANNIEGFESKNPIIHYAHNGVHKKISCDFVAACDGFHGIGRKMLPKKSFNEFSVTYPYSWLGILANVAPSSHELIYAYHKNGFALSSLRSNTVSRLYLQVDNDDTEENWSDQKIWDQLSERLASDGYCLTSGPIFEKSITPMRSYFIDNMQHGNLFLAGDAAHIVPPTGGKGLNLAVADVKHLVDGFVDFYQNHSMHYLKNYSKIALQRIWRAQDFSNYMTTLFHKQDEHGSFTYNLQKAKYDYLKISKSYLTTLAENYVGLPFEAFKTF
jgi:p-hydroxybenzoate 3-monooxygenase